jgi:predicted sulfurtransferase
VNVRAQQAHKMAAAAAARAATAPNEQQPPPHTSAGDADQVVLLYYKYVDLTGREDEVAAWFRSFGDSLVGRVRVAADGVNATVGGSSAAIDAHIAAARAHPLLRGGDIDYIVAPAAAAASAAVVAETGFDRLTVTVRPELVSLGRAPAGGGSTHGSSGCDPLRGAARHVSPAEFHEMLLNARGGGGSGSDGGNGGDDDDAPLVLLDVRNAYETAIGR